MNKDKLEELILTKSIYNKGLESTYKEYVHEITGITLPESMKDFYTGPASTKFHGSNPYGLIQHSLCVYKCALDLATAFNMKENEINPIACIFHDLCKANAYKPVATGYGYAYNSDMIVLPHGSESVIRLRNLGIVLPVSWELAVAYHMGAFNPGDIQNYSNACKKYKEVLLLHTADMMATSIYKR